MIKCRNQRCMHIAINSHKFKYHYLRKYVWWLFEYGHPQIQTTSALSLFQKKWYDHCGHQRNRAFPSTVRDNLNIYCTTGTVACGQLHHRRGKALNSQKFRSSVGWATTRRVWFSLPMSLKHMDPSWGGEFALQTGMPSGQFDTHLLFSHDKLYLIISKTAWSETSLEYISLHSLLLHTHVITTVS